MRPRVNSPRRYISAEMFRRHAFGRGCNTAWRRFPKQKGDLKSSCRYSFIFLCFARVRGALPRGDEVKARRWSVVTPRHAPTYKQ